MLKLLTQVLIVNFLSQMLQPPGYLQPTVQP